MHLEDRRRKRSQDPLIALHYQLSRVRQEGALETLVLADSTGVLVAGAGSWAACEELAAYAPLLAHDDHATPRLDSIKGEVEVRALRIDGQDVLLCARPQKPQTGAGIDRWALDVTLERATVGVTRILSAS